MYMLVWLSFFVGLLTLVPYQVQEVVSPLDPAGEYAGGSWEGSDFSSYRNRAIAAVVADKSLDNCLLTDAEVGKSSSVGVEARMVNGTLYVYAALPVAHLGRIRELLGGSYAIGVNNGGLFENGLGAGVALPSFVPEGAIVSVTEISR